MIQVTPYSQLNTLLYTFVTQASQILGPNFIGAYLLGSFALGDFDEHSDVDWMFIMRDPLDAESVEKLQGMHAEIYALDNPWAKYLEGSYMPQNCLHIPFNCQQELWYLDNGAQQLIQSTHDNTLVERSVLHSRALILSGPEPERLVDRVPVDELRAEMRQGALAWAEEILDDPQGINSHFYQSFAVLHFCRVYHDIQAGAVHSKRTGSEWTKTQMPDHWHGLIDRAWSGRPQPELSSRRPADPEDFKLTLEFIALMKEKITRVQLQPVS